MLEVVEGRQPFPRIAPPYRRGLDPADPGAGASAATVELAGPAGTDEPPALVDNVETIANLAGILAHGSAWFRGLGTPRSPGTIVCTVTGHTRRHGVAEVPMGTPLAAIIDEIGGGARPGRALVAAISGVANAFVPAAQFDTPATYEEMAGSRLGLGAAGFIVLDDEVDPVAAAHAIARFLAVESCGQCEPCKLDGLAIADRLDAIRTSTATDEDLDDVRDKLETVDRGARCALAQQQRPVVGEALALFPDAFDRHLSGDLPAASVRSHAADRRSRRGTGDPRHESRRQAAGLDVRAHLVRRLARRPPRRPAGAHRATGHPRGARRAGGRLGARRPGRPVPRGARRPSPDPRTRRSRWRRPPTIRPRWATPWPRSARSSDDTAISANGCCTRCSIAISGASATMSRAVRGPSCARRSSTSIASPASDRREPAICTISSKARGHIDAEEGAVLPLVRRRLDPAQLDELRDALAEAAATSTTECNVSVSPRWPTVQGCSTADLLRALDEVDPPGSVRARSRGGDRHRVARPWPRRHTAPARRLAADRPRTT